MVNKISQIERPSCEDHFMYLQLSNISKTHEDILVWSFNIFWRKIAFFKAKKCPFSLRVFGINSKCRCFENRSFVLSNFHCNFFPFLLLPPVRFVYQAWNKSQKFNKFDYHPKSNMRWIRGYHSRCLRLLDIFPKTIVIPDI